MIAGNPKPSTDAEYLDNYEVDTLYRHDFLGGAYFTVVHSDSDGAELQLSKKIALKITYIKAGNRINCFEVIKLDSGQESGRVKITIKNIDHITQFLDFVLKANLSAIEDRKTSLVVKTEVSYSQELLHKLLSEAPADAFKQLLNDGCILSHDLVNVGYRRKQLQIFQSLLEEHESWKTYCSEKGFSTHSEEKCWQHFFESNQWIFGYGLDYRFMSILQREASISTPDLDGGNTVIADYLMGDRMFTAFVEIKKPSTKLFGNGINRSNSWCLSNDFICAVSQILEQKAAGQLRLEQTAYNTKGELVTQKPYDSKVILVIGHWGELNQAGNTQEREIKKKTFELYRRDSRNIEILTYDELFERAKYIVEGKSSEA